MTFKEAEEKVRKIAGGRYCSIRYDRIYAGGGKGYIPVCDVYIDGVGWHTAETFLQAILMLQGEEQEEVMKGVDA